MSGLRLVCSDDFDFLKSFWIFPLFNDSYLENLVFIQLHNVLELLNLTHLFPWLLTGLK